MLRRNHLKMQTISATELARNTRQILDKVVSRGETVTIERNSSVIAQIIPPLTRMSVAEALVGLIRRPASALTAVQGDRWLKDSKSNFNNDVKDPWA
jgi:antitoxin (DNA-binding transcriptional repressor) of toxin-antitoxin stability system